MALWSKYGSMSSNYPEPLDYITESVVSTLTLVGAFISIRVLRLFKVYTVFLSVFHYINIFITEGFIIWWIRI